MKRMMAIVLALMLVLALNAASAAGGEVGYDRLVGCAMRMRAVAQGDFMDLKGVPEDTQGLVRDWTKGIDETPDLVLRMDVYGSAHVLQYKALFKSEHPLVSMEAQSTGVGEIINGAMTMAAMETYQPEATYRRCAQANTALDYDEIYADPDAQEGGQLYILLYADAEPLFILTNVENGAVALTCYIIPSMELASCTSYAQAAMWFMSWGCPLTGAEVKAE